jgi:hypothetical protein
MSKVTPPMRQASPLPGSLFPMSVSPPERFSLLRGISRGGRLEAVGGRGPAGQETRGVLRARPRLGGVGRSLWLGSLANGKDSSDRSRSPTTG